MTEAYVFDAIRTPRGKGKKDGSLHEVKPVDLLAGTLTALKERHDFDTAAVDDVVMGVVSPRLAINDTAASTGTVGWQTLTT